MQQCCSCCMQQQWDAKLWCYDLIDNDDRKPPGFTPVLLARLTADAKAAKRLRLAASRLVKNNEAACAASRLKQEADAKAAIRLQSPATSGLHIFSEAFSHEHCSIFKQAACSSNLAAADTNSFKHVSFLTSTPEQERRREEERDRKREAKKAGQCQQQLHK